MKKIVLVTLVILALLVSMLPMSTALAAKSRPPTAVFIKNQTGAPITLVLTSASARQNITLPTGSYYITVPVANYTYVAATACANRSGSLNLTRRAQLYFSCKSAGEQIVFARIVPR